MGCHPQDPGVPKGSGWRGIDAVLGSPEGLRRFVSIKDSPYHGLNFCQGTVSEQLEKPGEQIFDVIRYFGSRKKIFSVHFRNIEGGFLNFRDAFWATGIAAPVTTSVGARRTSERVGHCASRRRRWGAGHDRTTAVWSSGDGTDTPARRRQTLCHCRTQSDRDAPRLVARSWSDCSHRERIGQRIGGATSLGWCRAIARRRYLEGSGTRDSCAKTWRGLSLWTELPCRAASTSA